MVVCACVEFCAMCVVQSSNIFFENFVTVMVVCVRVVFCMTLRHIAFHCIALLGNALHCIAVQCSSLHCIGC